MMTYADISTRKRRVSFDINNLIRFNPGFSGLDVVKTCSDVVFGVTSGFCWGSDVIYERHD